MAVSSTVLGEVHSQIFLLTLIGVISSKKTDHLQRSRVNPSRKQAKNGMLLLVNSRYIGTGMLSNVETVKCFAHAPRAAA